MRHRQVGAGALLLAALIACNGSANGDDASTPSWRASALALVPAGHVAGEAYRTDEAAMEGLLAVYPASADDPKSPLSAFAPREVLVVKLGRRDDALRAISAELKPRSESAQSESGDEQAELQAKLEARRGELPPGTEPCEHHGWSIDKDPAGLNVRAEPSATAAILGKLPPPYKLKLGGAENTPEGGWLTEFHIIGYRSGWLLIEGATPPGKAYEDEKRYPRNSPKPFAGRGWVAANKVGAAFANGAIPEGGLFQAPHADARRTKAEGTSVGDSPARIFACSGSWALVEVNGVRGWWRSLCSNQVTTCS